MAKMNDWNAGEDAAYIKPKFVPDNALRARDNSGGLGFEPYTEQFGDGGYVTGMKPHLSTDSTGGTKTGGSGDDAGYEKQRKLRKDQMDDAREEP